MPTTKTSSRETLTERQERFCIEYVLNKGNASEAARRAGYSDSSGADAVTGYENLRNPKIIQRICEIREESGVLDANVSIEWAISLLTDTAERCMQREEIRDSEGTPTGEYKFDSRGAVAAVKAICDIKGWNDKKEPKPNDSIPEQIQRLEEERKLELQRIINEGVEAELQKRQSESQSS